MSKLLKFVVGGVLLIASYGIDGFAEFIQRPMPIWAGMLLLFFIWCVLDTCMHATRLVTKALKKL